MLFLKTANYGDFEKEYLFVRDIPAEENSFTNEWHGVSREDFERVALRAMIDSSKGINLPEGYVPEEEIYLRVDRHNTPSLRVMLNTII